MGALVGLLFGLGLFALWHPSGPSPTRTRRARWSERIDELLVRADIEAVSAAQLIAASAVFAGFCFLLTWGISESPPIAVAFASFASMVPLNVVRWRARQRSAELRELWPEVTDNLASGVRAGLSLPEALMQLAVRGPEQLRSPFQRFGEDYRATGQWAESLNRLKYNLADPVGDRIVETLRLAREVGGHDLGRLLRALSGFLREDARTRAELEARQSWTVNAARLAVAAPWVLLAMLSLRPEVVAPYNSPTGVLVLGAGGVTSLLAYQLMKRIARLPQEQRVLR
ncbi:MAG: type II secretion system F family protein [Actinomycetota bacterium]|nr:type II secretion system F family protein [Actinomycetota bacterium]